MATAVSLIARHVRRRAAARHLRQDRAGPGDRRAGVRPSAGDLRAGRADAVRPVQRREGRASASSTPRARSAATELLEAESAVLPRARHLHLLRHRQLQPDADGDHGPAPARGGLRQPEHAAARRADPRPRPQRAVRDHGAGQRATRRSAAVVDERAFVNGIVGLLATGGSTNHTLHLVAMARAAGIPLNWDDFADLSAVVAAARRASIRTGKADVNHFQRRAAWRFVIGELLDAGLVHARRADRGRRRRAASATGSEPRLDGDGSRLARRRRGERRHRDAAPGDEPFRPTGGLKLLRGQSRPRASSRPRR